MRSILIYVFYLGVLLPLALYGWWCLWNNYIDKPFREWLSRKIYRAITGEEMRRGK